MRYNPIVLASAFAMATLPALVSAQQLDNTETLPDAKAGECYAKVITPAQFTTQSETVVVQEASERVQIIPAKYESVEQTIVVKEASRTIKAVAAEYEDRIERIEISPASTTWMSTGRNDDVPAGPAMLDALTGSGINLATVSPGSCFREYYTPAEFKTETEQVLVSEASDRIIVSPAEFETVSERVVVKEATSQVIDVPASYRSVSQQVLVEPAKQVWKQGRGLVERIDNTTGEIMCLVEIPARFETITKTVLDKPATTRQVDVPAVYKTVQVQRLVKPASVRRESIPAEYRSVTKRVKVAEANFYWLAKGESPVEGAKYTGNEACLLPKEAEFRNVKARVLKTPATTQVVDVPATYETVRVDRLVSAATERRIQIPEKTRTVAKRVQTAPAKLEWRKVLCETNMTRDIVVDLQRALKREGFDPGPLDGVLGIATNRALESYQTRKNLDRGGLTYETLEALDVDT